MYANPIKLYSGVNNPIKIQCMNTDQKKIDVSNVTIQLGLFEPETENELIINTAFGIDSANGIVGGLFTPSELDCLTFGFYELGITAFENSGNVYPVFINDSFGSRLPVQYCKGPVLGNSEPIAMTWVDSMAVGVVSNDVDLSSRPMNSTLATMCANLVNYTGNIVAQGTMISTPTSSDFGNISYSSYTNSNGPIFQSVSGSYAWIRFVLDGADPNHWGNISANSVVTWSNIRT